MNIAFRRVRPPKSLLFPRFSGLLSSDAFIFRIFSDESATYPEGFLDQGVLESVYPMVGADQSSLKYTPSAEWIPNNWYTRAVGDPNDVPFFLSDFKTLVQEHPEFLTFGRNIKAVNSLADLDVGA